MNDTFFYAVTFQEATMKLTSFLLFIPSLFHNIFWLAISLRLYLNSQSVSLAFFFMSCINEEKKKQATFI